MRTEEVRHQLATRLRDRSPEIEAAILTRVYAVSEPTARPDPEYAHGLRTTVAASVEHGLSALDRSEDQLPPIPSAVLSQARLAARAGISLETVLRRYFAGYSLLSDFVIEEASRGELISGSAFQRLMRAQASLFDRLLVAVGEEYAREEYSHPGSAEQRRAERVRRLLAGELLDAPDLSYEFKGHHLGLIAAGPGAPQALGELASSLDRTLLLVRRGEGTLWAWLGGRRGLDPEQVRRDLLTRPAEDLVIALGEPGEGLAGWRLTHRQARAAMPVALRGGESVVRYADVALLASILRDELLVASLHELYLAPLEEERDGGEAARETLRAYFEADRNVSSAAAALGISRQAANGRIRAIEERLELQLGGCASELELALRLQALDTSQGRSLSTLPDSNFAASRDHAE